MAFAKKSKYNNKARQSELKECGEELERTCKVLKTHLLSSKTFAVDVRKEALVEAGQACKAALVLIRDEENLCKDMIQDVKGKKGKKEGAEDDAGHCVYIVLHFACRNMSVGCQSQLF